MRISDWSSDVCSSDLTYDVDYEGSKFLLRVTKVQAGAYVSAVDPRGLPASGDAPVKLVAAPKAALGAGWARAARGWPPRRWSCASATPPGATEDAPAMSLRSHAGRASGRVAGRRVGERDG